MDALLRLHAAIDAMTAEVEQQHTQRLQCKKGCADCCVDDLTVFEVEARRIRAHCGDVLDQAPHPAGRCAFLDADDACRIYEHRPYVCRTQGLPLRWIDQDDDGLPVEMRDICPLNELEDAPITALQAEVCWTIGPIEAKLAELQRSLDGGELRRVPLRSLFRVQLG